jgi:hypothetical protein
LNKSVFPLIFGLTIGVSGCGTYVPEIQDVWRGDADGGRVYVRDIVENVRCNVSKAFRDLYDQEATIPNERGLKDIAFLNDWGAQITLNLTVDEQGAVSPTGNLTPIGQPKNWIFNLGLGGSISSEAQRVDKVSYIYMISDLR